MQCEMVLRHNQKSCTNRLICQKKNCFEAEMARAEVEQVFKTWTKKFHHHHVIVTLRATPFYQRNPHYNNHQLTTIILLSPLGPHHFINGIPTTTTINWPPSHYNYYNYNMLQIKLCSSTRHDIFFALFFGLSLVTSRVMCLEFSYYAYPSESNKFYSKFCVNITTT